MEVDAQWRDGCLPHQFSPLFRGRNHGSGCLHAKAPVPHPHRLRFRDWIVRERMSFSSHQLAPAPLLFDTSTSPQLMVRPCRTVGVDGRRRVERQLLAWFQWDAVRRIRHRVAKSQVVNCADVLADGRDARVVRAQHHHGRRSRSQRHVRASHEGTESGIGFFRLPPTLA